MKTSLYKSKTINILASIGIIIIIWAVSAQLVNQTVIIPKPIETLRSMYNIIVQENFWWIIGSSIQRTLISIILALISGIILGILAGINIAIEWVLKPFIVIIKTVPTMALIILALIWLGGQKAPILLSFLIVFPIFYANTLQGIKNTDKKLLEMAKVYQIKKKLVIKDIYFPYIEAYLIAAMNTAVGLAFKVNVAVEVMGETKMSIGKSLQIARLNINTTDVFAWSILLVITVSIFDIITKSIYKICTNMNI